VDEVEHRFDNQERGKDGNGLRCVERWQGRDRLGL
jgi:hypothetical protein